MQKIDKAYSPYSVLVLVFLVTIARLFYLSTTDTGLFFDEAQYWTWSKALDWGFYSKPPVIAWLISLTGELCGDTTECIRLSSPVLHGLTTITIFFIALRLYDERTAFWSSIIYLTLPAVTVSSAFISTDAPLMFFWALALCSFIGALDKNSMKWWVLLGISGGLGMMSKYTMVVFPLSALLFLMSSKSFKHHFKNPKLYISAAIALAIFLPNVFWNISNNFVSASHSGDNVFSGGFSFYFMEGLEFIAAQLVIFGPILFPALVMVGIRGLELWKNDNDRVMIFFILPLDIAIVIAFISSAQAHWAAPAYVSGTILVTNFLLNLKKFKLIKISIAINILAALAFYHLDDIGTIYGKDPLARVKIWNELSSEVSKSLEQHPDAIIASDERKIIAPLIYNLRSVSGAPYPAMKWNPKKDVRDYYDMNNSAKSYIDRDIILITRSSNTKQFSKYFESYEKIAAKELYSKTFHIYLLKNFKGY